jgi:hypothetical protein
MNADEILDMLHQIREQTSERYRGKPNEVYLRDLHARTAKTIEELGLKRAEPRGGSDWPRATVPKTREG